jgi:hypothetical protein
MEQKNYRYVCNVSVTIAILVFSSTDNLVHAPDTKNLHSEAKLMRATLPSTFGRMGAATTDGGSGQGRHEGEPSLGFRGPPESPERR